MGRFAIDLKKIWDAFSVFNKAFVDRMANNLGAEVENMTDGTLAAIDVAQPLVQAMQLVGPFLA